MIHPYVYAGLKADRLIVKDYLSNTPAVHVYQKLLECVLEVLRVTKEEIQGKERVRYIVDARKIIIHILRENTNMGYMHMGRLMNKNHATCIHAYNATNNLLKVDKTFRKNYNLVILAFENQLNKQP